MRLLVGVLVLVITALDVWAGHPDRALQIAGAAAGMLLLVSVVVDRVTPERRHEYLPRRAPKRRGARPR